jgi:glycosyltransferase involved in cell wall biosynthesis
MKSASKQQREVEISVIIPTRNRLAYLKEAVASVLAQDHRDREVVVVDDASEDGTWAWLSSLTDPDVRVLRMEQHGERSAARNLGLNYAQGKYVLFLDDDDLLAPSALSYLQVNAEKCSEALAVVGARISFDDHGNWYRPPHPRWTVKRKAWPEILFGYCPPQGQTLMRKSTFATAGSWNEQWSVAEDHELWLRIATQAGVILFCPRVVRRMRIHAGQTLLVGRDRDCLNLRRDFAARLPKREQTDAFAIVSAHRLSIIAGRLLAKGSYRKAARYHVVAIARAPWLLFSPWPATLLLGGLWRALVGAVVGRSHVARIRQMKAALRRRTALPQEKSRLSAAGHLSRGDLSQ